MKTKDGMPEDGCEYYKDINKIREMLSPLYYVTTKKDAILQVKRMINQCEELKTKIAHAGFDYFTEAKE